MARHAGETEKVDTVQVLAQSSIFLQVNMVKLAEDFLTWLLQVVVHGTCSLLDHVEACQWAGNLQLALGGTRRTWVPGQNSHGWAGQL